MSLRELVPARGRIARANPVAKLLASLVIALVLVATVDPVSAATALVLELMVLPFVGMQLKDLRRTIPLWIAAPLAGVSMVLYGRDSGAVLAQLWFVSVTEGSLGLGLAVTLRVLAIGLPSVVLFATTDPTDLADGLAQILRLPSRFVLGALAGMRLLGLVAEDWRMLALARRARGVGDTRGPLQALRSLGGRIFVLLVLAIRRGSRLATAMEAKGFGAQCSRTWARESRLKRGDIALIVGGVGIATAAVVAAVASGSWTCVVHG
ncbi:energy-coupling factor transporter transmembrane component T family protein [Rathayibacter toxicus]|uniref:energy-coupling factor transporter transmembrane component T family protein n=1 Tax=Rathayibacter toxicus TaxID=145458 RepID=UPI001C03C971|nr:energy-coupling factor transporter transmembrane component T [Rathayibacter toxicus]QWL32408.1 energy-coupling factor transporter transmembrane protein EcfT [Rathayibacter toxicus]QWL34502.1 energy-coupling factor transporter transmembrane protein EcfT [Rathayibacter toxicus]QWL36634.1 energy-coupling factor transporter transmembrane protein EcfT [Rathayibacter toxicus]QWL38723.1 energy-coupling factor transporter transmembrane protein EcfT [Rathayibacter toxicus]QWL40811.1 energy-coupling 